LFSGKLKVIATPTQNLCNIAALGVEAEPNRSEPLDGDRMRVNYQVDEVHESETGTQMDVSEVVEEGLPECTCSSGGGEVRDDEGFTFEDVNSGSKELKEVASEYQRLSSAFKSDIGNTVNAASTSPTLSSAESHSSDTENGKDVRSTACQTDPDDGKDVRSTTCQTDPDDGKDVRSTACQTDPVQIKIFDLITTDEQLKAFTGVTFSTLDILLKLVLDISPEKCESSLKNRILLSVNYA